MFKKDFGLKNYDKEVFIGELQGLKKTHSDEVDFLDTLINIVNKYNPNPVDMINRIQLLSYYTHDSKHKETLSLISGLLSG